MSVGVLVLGMVFGALAGLRLDTWPEALAYAVVALASTLLVATDLAAHEIPHRIMWPSVLALIVSLALAAGIEQSWGRFGGALLTGLVIAVVYFVIAWFGKGQFGVGDVSLSLLYGIFLGWLGLPYALVGAFGAFLVHVPVSIGLLVALPGRRPSSPRPVSSSPAAAPSSGRPCRRADRSLSAGVRPRTGSLCG